MAEDNYQFIARADEIEEGKGRPYSIGDHRIALIRYQGELFAVDDLCTHADAPLAFGMVQDGCILCPWHFAEFDLKTGEALSGPATGSIRTYEIKEKDGDVLIKI